MAEPLWGWQELVVASGGNADGVPAAPITGISIDTRSFRPGEVFVALKGQRDGHEFVAAAFAAGASAALVEAGYVRKPGDGALIRVGDTLQGLEAVARAARARLQAHARVIAITGSVGKTGTTAMLRACLARLAATHAPEKSFNNHWGVPLTLARMPSSVGYAVIEIGMNHAGEITPLTRIARPHVAVVTTVEPVHLAHFGSVEEIADAKAEIFAGLEPGGTAVINRDNPHYERLLRQATAAGARILDFGRSRDAVVRPATWEIGADGSRIEVDVGGRRVAYALAALGEHLAMNSLAVVAALLAVGADLDLALPALSAFEPPQGRGARATLALPDGGRVLLVDESYNANPASMRAALAALATIPREVACRRIAVLGDMLELGPRSGDLHRGLADAVLAAGIDRVFCAGPDMAGLFADLPAALQAASAPASDGIRDALLAEMRDGDAVMIKGSLGSRMGPLVAALKGRYPVVDR